MSLKRELFSGRFINSIDWSLEGKFIGIGDIEGQLKIYESSNPSQGTFNSSPQHIINMHGRGIKTVKFSGDC